MSATIPQAETPASAVVPMQPDPVVTADPNTPATPSAAPETEGDQADDSAQHEQPRDDKGRFAKANERIQRQISDLTAQKHSVRREVESLQKRLASLNEQYQRASRVDPNDYEATETARVTRATIGVQAQIAQADISQAMERERATRAATFHAKVDAAREQIPDIDQSLGTFGQLPLSEAMCDVIAESDRAAHIANYFGRNPGEAMRINGLPPHLQGAEIARIEARVTTQPIKRISQAPAPVRTVSGGGGNPAPDLGSLSMADYIKARQNGAG